MSWVKLCGQNAPWKSSFLHVSIQAARWLTIDNRPGDSLFFHYSGHGGRQIDRSGIEADGYDETILPLDFETAGQIVDDEVRIPWEECPGGSSHRDCVFANRSGSLW